MKNKILCGMIVILSIILIIEVSLKKKTNFSFESQKEEIKIDPPKNETLIKVLDPDTSKIETLNLEDYIVGVVSAEMPASFELEALKAQAIAARTFAVYKIEHSNNDYDVRIGVSDQAYNTLEQMQEKWKDKFSENYQKIKKAVGETAGEIMTYHGMVIESFYFSMSNGQTENCELVFQESLPYLTSVESSWDNESLQNYEVVKEFSKEEFCNLLNISCEEIIISDINRTNSGRIQTMKGTEVRKKLTLRSTDFQIDINDTIKITTKGNGHGVGMSQYGANGMAKEGKSVQEILTHYYQNIEFSKI